MKKLKIIKNDKPIEEGCIIQLKATVDSPYLNRYAICPANEQHELWQRVELIIISNEEIKAGDLCYSVRGIIGRFATFENCYINECKKIILEQKDMPDSFIQAVIDGKIKDGDEVNIIYTDFTKLEGTDKCISNAIKITKPESKTYSEEQLLIELREFGCHICGHCTAITDEFVRNWWKENKNNY